MGRKNNGQKWPFGGIDAAAVIPAPNWFIAADILLTYLPMAWLATGQLHQERPNPTVLAKRRTDGRRAEPLTAAAQKPWAVGGAPHLRNVARPRGVLARGAR